MAKTIDDSEAQLATATPTPGGDEPKEVRDSGIIEDLLRPCLVEFMATALFLFFCFGHVVMCTGGQAKNPLYVVNSTDSTTMNQFTPGLSAEFATVQSIALSFGLCIFVLVYSCAHLSGANINPAVTCALVVTRRISLTKAALYIISQCLGACVGCGLVAAIAPGGDGWKDTDGNLMIGWNAVDTKAGFTVGGAFIAEMIGTSILMFTVMAAIDANQQKAAEHINVLAPFSIGVSVFLAHLMLIPITGCSINPARTFGAAVVTGHFDHHWVFWLAPMLGATLMAFFYDLLLDESPDKANCNKYMVGPTGW